VLVCRLSDTKRKIYMTLVRPVVTWTMSVGDINNLLVSERNKLGKIFGPVKSKEGRRKRNNNEKQKLIIKGEDIVKHIKTQRIIWWGHLDRMEDTKLVTITDWYPKRVRTKGRPKKRWRDEVVNDLKKLEMRNWSQIFNYRKAWNDLLQKTKTHVRVQIQKTRKIKGLNEICNSFYSCCVTF